MRYGYAHNRRDAVNEATRENTPYLFVMHRKTYMTEPFYDDFRREDRLMA